MTVLYPITDVGRRIQVSIDCQAENNPLPSAQDFFDAGFLPRMGLQCTQARRGSFGFDQSVEEVVDWNRIAGSWKQLEGKVKAKWGLLTDDDLMHIKGSRELLVGKIQERYGIAKHEARKQIDDYFTSQGY